MFKHILKLLIPVFRVVEPGAGGSPAEATRGSQEAQPAQYDDNDAIAALSAELDAELEAENNNQSDDPDGSADDVDDVNDDDPDDPEDPTDPSDQPDPNDPENPDDHENPDDREDPEDPENADDPEDLPDGLPKAAYKEIKKYRKRAQEAEQQLSQLTETKKTLEADLARIKADKVVLAPTAQDPLADVVDAAHLNNLESFATQLNDWLQDNPEGGVCPLLKGEGDEPRQLSAEEVKGYKAATRRDLRAIPARREYLEKNAAIEKTMTEHFPELADAKSDISMRINQILANAPELKRHVGYRMGALYYELGKAFVQVHGKNAIKAVREMATKKPAANGGKDKGKGTQGKPPVIKPHAPPAFRKPAAVRQRQIRQQRSPQTREEAAALIDVSDHEF